MDEVVEKRKNAASIGSQTSVFVKRSKTNSEKETTITTQSSLAMKGSSAPKSEHGKTKSGETVNDGTVVLGVPLVNSTQSALNNNNKKLNNDSSHVNDQFQVKKKRKKSKKFSRKCNSDDCPKNLEAGSSKNKNQNNKSSKRTNLMYELRC